MNRMIVGVDDGYAQMKVYGGAVDAPVKCSFPSSIRPGRFGLSSLTGSGQVASYRVEEGEEFTVSSAVQAEPTTFESYHVSSMNRVLVQHALVEAGFSGMEVDLVVGLPVSGFFADGKRNEVAIARKVENLRKRVEPIGHRGSVAYGDIRVGCQGIAAFLEWVLDNELNVVRETPKRVGVVDVGGFTTDIAVILDGERVDQQRTGSSRIGLLDVLDMVQNGLRMRFQIQDRLPQDVLTDTLKTRRIRLWGREESVENMVDHVLAQFSAKLAREVERRFGSAADLDVILFVGGGANVLGGVLGNFPNAVIVDDPEMANARGLWKYARLHKDV